MFGVICRKVKEFELMDNREEIINEILELTNELTVEEVRTFIKMFEESKKRRGRNGSRRPIWEMREQSPRLCF